MTRLHVVDGTYELFRAHYSKRPSHTTPEGWNVKATVGVMSSLLSLLQDEQESVTHVAVAFDNPIRSFRNDLFAGYKTDEGMDEELKRQMDLVEEAVEALGVTVWSMKEFEADDALATAAVKYASNVEQVRLMSPDKDLGQCLWGSRVVSVDRRQEKDLNEEAFTLAKGIAPGSLPDWLALVGDSADGIPGLKGFGEKAASAVLGVYRKLENIPKDSAEWKVSVRGAEGLARTLREHFEDAVLYRKLATVRTDVPLKESFSQLEWAGVPRQRFLMFCQKLGVNSLEKRVKQWQE